MVLNIWFLTSFPWELFRNANILLTQPSRWFWCTVDCEIHWYKIYRLGITLPICTFGNVCSQRLRDLKSHTADKFGIRTQVYLLLFLNTRFEQPEFMLTQIYFPFLEIFIVYSVVTWLHNWHCIDELTLAILEYGWTTLKASC